MTDEEQKRIFAKNIKYYIARTGKQQKEVAKDLGYSQTTFNSWCTGKILPRMNKVQKIATYFDIEVSDLLDDKGYLTGKKIKKGIAVPVYGRVAAGIPIEMIEDIIDIEEIPEALAKTGEFFGLQIHGDSMEPRMKDGDVVIVRRQEDAETGETVIVTVNGTDATCKTIKKYRDGLELISTNPSYQPIFYSKREVQIKPVQIIGKVIELRAKY